MKGELNEVFSDPTINKYVEEVDIKFRNSFSKYIIPMKYAIHTKQAKCYSNNTTDTNNNNNLIKAEECARKAYIPMLLSKTYITNLVTAKKEKLEECKYNILLKLAKSNSSIANKKLIKCVENYKKHLNELNSEIEYIYQGYSKNLEI